MPKPLRGTSPSSNSMRHYFCRRASNNECVPDHHPHQRFCDRGCYKWNHLDHICADPVLRVEVSAIQNRCNVYTLLHVLVRDVLGVASDKVDLIICRAQNQTPLFT